LLVVGHDSINIADGVGGPQDPAVSFGPDDILGDLDGLEIERAQRARMPVTTDDGDLDAIVHALRRSWGPNVPTRRGRVA
jgi:hypothetical protein